MLFRSRSRERFESISQLGCCWPLHAKLKETNGTRETHHKWNIPLSKANWISAVHLCRVIRLHLKQWILNCFNFFLMKNCFYFLFQLILPHVIKRTSFAGAQHLLKTNLHFFKKTIHFTTAQKKCPISSKFSMQTCPSCDTWRRSSWKKKIIYLTRRNEQSRSLKEECRQCREGIFVCVNII